MGLVREGIVGRILAAVALISLLFIPNFGLGYTSLNGVDALKIYFEAFKNFSQIPQGLQGSLVIGFILDILSMLCAVVALRSSQVSTQASSGIIALIAGLIDYLLAPLEATKSVEPKAGYYLALVSFVGLALLPVIDRLGSQIGASGQARKPAVISSSLHCSSCGTSNPADSRFCGNCGNVLAQAALSSEPSESGTSPREEWSCQQCATTIESGDTFCGWCGTKIQGGVQQG